MVRNAAAGVSMLRVWMLLTMGAWVLVGGSSAPAAAPAAEALAGVWDAGRYIGLDEIRAGMEGHCLTEYGPGGVERFALEVVDVVRDIEPGRDAILVKGLDERFIHTGPVAGCSGSPVYIEGRLAGALAFAWTLSKDPLYGATPIAEMLWVGASGSGKGVGGAVAGGFEVLDWREPIDLGRFARWRVAADGPGRVGRGLSRLVVPVMTSGLSEAGCRELEAALRPFGMAVAGGSGAQAEGAGVSARFEPGSCLMVPLVSGDISISVQGTVTEVVGDTVYGFGHGFLGYGDVDLPIATGRVHTVVSNLERSFKLASVGRTIGALRQDAASAVVGRMGVEAGSFPLTITVHRFNDVAPRRYECRVARNRMLTAAVVRAAVSGAALRMGDLPPEHSVAYRASIGLAGDRRVKFANVSTGSALSEAMAEVGGIIEMVMNNPYEILDVESVDFEVTVTPRTMVSRIWSVEVADTQVRPGQRVPVEVIVESVLAGKRRHRFEMAVPENLKPGKYGILVCGAYGYEDFLRKNAPHRLVAQSIEGLMTALNDLLNIERSRLYCILMLPAGGVTVETQELPDLPATKALVMQSPGRTLTMLPYRQWVQDSRDIGAVVLDRSVVEITVEK